MADVSCSHCGKKRHYTTQSKQCLMNKSNLVPTTTKVPVVAAAIPSNTEALEQEQLLLAAVAEDVDAMDCFPFI